MWPDDRATQGSIISAITHDSERQFDHRRLPKRAFDQWISHMRKGSHRKITGNPPQEIPRGALSNPAFRKPPGTELVPDLSATGNRNATAGRHRVFGASPCRAERSTGATVRSICAYLAPSTGAQRQHGPRKARFIYSQVERTAAGQGS